LNKKWLTCVFFLAVEILVVPDFFWTFAGETVSTIMVLVGGLYACVRVSWLVVIVGLSAEADVKV
jgi:hypothetical protein